MRARVWAWMHDRITADGVWPTVRDIAREFGISAGGAAHVSRDFVRGAGSAARIMGVVAEQDLRASLVPRQRFKLDEKGEVVETIIDPPAKPTLAARIGMALMEPPPAPEPPDIVAYVAGRLDRPPLTDAQAKVKEMIDARRADVESAG